MTKEYRHWHRICSILLKSLKKTTIGKHVTYKKEKIMFYFKIYKYVYIKMTNKYIDNKILKMTTHSGNTVDYLITDSGNTVDYLLCTYISKRWNPNCYFEINYEQHITKSWYYTLLYKYGLTYIRVNIYKQTRNHISPLQNPW